MTLFAIVLLTVAASAKKCQVAPPPINVNWRQLPGNLKHVEVNDDGSLFGVNGSDNIYFCDKNSDCKWMQVPGSLKQISSTNDFVCGVNNNDNIYCTENCDEVPAWKQLPGALKYVSVNNKGNL
jgi:hypothetical protein